MLISGSGQGVMPTLLVIGVFYGFKHVRMLIIARGYDLGTTVAMAMIPFILGAIIGVFVLAWRIVKAIFELIALIVSLATSKTLKKINVTI